MMIVVVIIGLMAGVVTYATTGYLERAKRERARSDIATYSGAVDAFYLAKGVSRQPGRPQGAGAGVHQGLQNDPWGRPTSMFSPAKAGRTTSSATAPMAGKAAPARMPISPTGTRTYGDEEKMMDVARFNPALASPSSK